MARKDALFRRYEVVVVAGALAAHAAACGKEFRQRDVKFYIELFDNWLESSSSGSRLEISNTQVARFLDELSEQALAKRRVVKQKPVYSLTRTGLIELVGRAVEEPFSLPADQFFFLYYFLENYKPRIEALVREQGKSFPLALRLELETLLNTETLLNVQLDYIEREIKKLDERANDGVESARLVSRMFSEDAAYEEVVRAVEETTPYELNSQKPLSELFSELPPDIGRWELEVGGNKRAEQIWGPMRSMLLTYAELIRGFLQS